MAETKLPTVSVIIPTYNRAHLIGRSINSVLNQTYQDFELIIVDDGSSDNTEEIIRAFNDPRILFLKHPENRGVSAARNTGIKEARGSYIAFQDSDDEWLPEKLEKQMAVFKQDKKGDLGLVLCETLGVIQNVETRVAPQANRLNYEQLISHLGAYGEGTQRFLLKRDLTAPELYFDEKLKAWEEWDLLLRLSRICRIDYVREALVRRYYNHDEPHLDNPQNRIKARRVLVRKYANELKTRPKSLSLSYWHNALDYYRLGKMRYTRCYLKAAVKAYPRNPDLYLQFIVSLFGRGGFKLYLGSRSFISSFLHKSKIA
jgi:glycosyltransferase involved in cell wall biosynthesis